MASKLDNLKKKAESLGIEMDANETISDLEAKIFAVKNTKTEVKQPEAPKRGRVIVNKTFKRRTDKREVKANG